MSDTDARLWHPCANINISIKLLVVLGLVYLVFGVIASLCSWLC
jgi:hypothetical protein